MLELEGRPGAYTIDAGPQRVMVTTIPVIPNREVIIRVFNTALATRFHLGPAYSSQGGLDGIYRGNRIDLTNLSTRRKIGLWNESYSWHRQRIPGKGLQEILNTYETMLRDLFDGHHGDILVDRAFDASEQVSQALIGVLKCSSGVEMRRQTLENTDALIPLKPVLDLLKRQKNED